MEAHPYADCFPVLSDDLLAELASDIERHGLRAKIVTYQGMILDGRNRHRACEMVAVKPKFEPFEGDDDEAMAFVISNNIHRRHLTDSQRAMAIESLASSTVGRPNIVLPEPANSANLRSCKVPPPKHKPKLTKAQAAKQAKVSKRLIEKARQVVKHGDKETVRRVRDGKLSINAAVQQIASKKQLDRPVDPQIDAWQEGLTEKCKEAFADLWKFQELLTSLLGVRQKIQAYCDLPAFAFLLKQQVLVDLENASRGIRHAKPYAACPWCEQKGMRRGDDGKVTECGACKKVGWVTKDRFDTAPADLKKKVPHP